MVIIGVLGCLLILLFVHLVMKDVMAPPFILSGIWILMYLLLLVFRSASVDLSSVYYLSFIGGLIFFVIGFFLAVRNKNKVKCNILHERKSKLRFKLPYIQIFLFIVFSLFLIYLLKILFFISQENTFNFWHTLRTGEKTGTFKVPILIEYSRSAVIALSIVCSIVFFTNPTIKNKRYFYSSGFIALFYVITAGNRGTIFMWILTIVFCYLLVKNYNNKKLLVIFSRLVLLILIIFIYTNFIKYVHVSESESYEFTKYILKHYFTSSPIAFVEWMKATHEHLHGANTFRFFIAVINSIGGNVDVTQTVQEPIQITKLGEETNVYTVLHYYASDFGLVYAFFVQIILGFFHGILYLKANLSKKMSAFFVALQAISYYPLLYHFFSDQYFTLFSSWLQYLFWFWLFTRKQFLISDYTEEVT